MTEVYLKVHIATLNGKLILNRQPSGPDLRPSLLKEGWYVETQTDKKGNLLQNPVEKWEEIPSCVVTFFHWYKIHSFI